MIPLADPTAASPLVSAVVALIVGLFGGGSMVALLRVGADKNKVVIEAAQGAVIVQTSVIDELQEARAGDREELARMKAALVELRGQLAQEIEQNALMRRRLAVVERQTNGGS